MSGLYEDILDQKTFRKIEALCTQEDLPQCNATCPMHVDNRKIIKHIQDGEGKEAYRLYTRTIPFPKIISHTCDRPCESKCMRNTIGGAIEIGELEKYIVETYSEEYKKPLFLPIREEEVAVIGGGLRGMMFAFDLLLKGFGVTIYEREEKLGGSLRRLPEEELPKCYLNEEIEKLFTLGMKVEYNKNISINNIGDVQEFLESEKKDGIYISNRSSKLFSKANRESLVIDDENKIIGGSRFENLDSTINKVCDGKIASMSMDRRLKKVSIMSGRAKEGPFETELHTNLEYYKDESPVDKQGDIFTSEEALMEANRCIQCECLECVKGCSFMRSYGSYPRRYVREVYNNLSIAMGIHGGNKMINTCNLCGQCKSLCPNGLDLGEMFLAARKLMVKSKKMPPSAHEFAILDMEYSNSDDFYLARHQYKHDKSKYLYFPSCQLAASEPDLTLEVYEDLCKKLEGGVGIFLSCCSIMSHWAGEEELFKENIERIRETWIDLGSPKLISSCPMCLKTLKEHGNIDTIGIWEIFDDNRFQFDKFSGVDKLTIYDSCSARYDERTQGSIRSLAENVGCEIDEMRYSLEDTPCCGYGGLTPFVDRKLADEITKDVTELSDEAYLTYCVNCRDRFLEQDKESYHILELLYDRESIKRTPPTWSERQENRKYVKRELISRYWKDEIMEEIDCKLYIDEDLKILLDERMILNSDLQKAILNAEDTKEYFKKEGTGNLLTSYRPGNVTFWVEYSREDDGYRVDNAYSHRMSFKILNE